MGPKFSTMRNRFEAQLTLGCTPIDQIEIPTKTRAHLAALFEALQYIFTHRQWNEQVFELLSEKITKGKQPTGRSGMSLWEIFVLAQVRLCLDLSYDELHYRANYDSLLRGILGVLPTDYSTGKQYEYQNIYDNVKLIDDQTLHQINDIIVQMGHQVFKKKEPDALHLKTDSFVVQTDTHFPTDYNLLWDSGRKCIDGANKLNIDGWRKSKNWHNSLKRLMQAVGNASRGGGKGKQQRVDQAVKAYLKKARALAKKVNGVLATHPTNTLEEAARIEEMRYYHHMLIKHIDLLDRRLLKGQKIAHNEKVFSVFQPYTELIKKGKTNPSVEIGKNLAITTDQHHLIVDWQIAEWQADNQLILAIARRTSQKYNVQTHSVDRGFSDMTIKAKLAEFIPQVIMPKKGRRNAEQKAEESAPAFVRSKNKHNAVESNINELEHRGLDRCPDRSYANFKRYIGLAVTAYNLHRIGRQLLAQRRTTQQVQKAA